MKEELIRVLNNKLDNVKVNIDSLKELNGKIDDENEKLSYVNSVLDIFKKDNSYNVLNFTELTKENFENVLDIIGGNIKDMFKTSSCNYEGLVYLINGINNGVSLSLTLEQENAINYFLQGVEGKCEEYEATIDGLLLVKDHFNIADIDVLNEKQATYEKVLDKLSKEDYVNEIDDVLDAINFSNISQDKIIDLLTYLLEYNSNVYEENKGKTTIVTESKEEVEETKEEVNDDKKQEVEEKNEEINLENKEELSENESDEYEEFHFPEFENIENVNEEDTTVESNEVVKENNIEQFKEEEENIFVPPEVSNENEKVEPLPVVDPLPMPEVGEDFIPPVDIPNFPIEEKNENSDFEGIVTDDDYEEINVDDKNTNDEQMTEMEDESTSSREVQRLFKEFNILKIDNYNDLLKGNIDNYRNILEFLKSNDLLGEFEKNEELLKEVLTCSNVDDLLDITNIIKNELSVDDEDYKMTLKIVANTIPSIFVRDGGNYENFVRNVKMFKTMGINLISLFDFSKEVFVANHKNLEHNYDIVKNYNINLDYKNLKYMLMLQNIGEKIDYFVESVYPDRTKNNEKFDGITYINTHPNKLSIVNDITIKRLRFSSENSKKVFGNKPNSLAGEITNMKVDVLEISPEYLSRFFDNKFDIITPDEVREYTKLCRNSSNIGNFTDELSFLEKYHNGLRYSIGDINISYNKVIRGYNTLRSYGIDKKKALLFAVCYNLIITNEEYNMIKETLERDGE